MADLTPLPTGHVGLNVTDLARSRRFYQETFGLELLGESTDAARRFALLGRDGHITLTLWQQSSGAFDRSRPGLHHLSFQAASVDEVRALEARLRQRGVRLLYDGVVPHGEGADSGGIFFEDPDGVRLEVFAPSGVQAAKTTKTEGPACGFF